MVQQYLPGLILNTVLRIVQDLDDPYQGRLSLGSMKAYPPKAMATVLPICRSVVCGANPVDAVYLP